jgi:non-canonical purine NTP pyrophosphatase (RdgB/HAM1 family)
MKLLVATNNAGKVREFADLLAGLPVELLSLSHIGEVTEVEETGATFEENAILKARGYALQSGIWALADDSGLEIEALGNRPGVLSARYGGEATGFDKKMEMLLAELAGADHKNRRARFVSAIAVADAGGDIKYVATGTVRGNIARSPRGSNGFGYDPIFVPEGFQQTFGELSDDIKGKISHRSRASAKIIRFLSGFIGGLT